MLPFWKLAIAPVLTAVKASKVVEIGALEGQNTKRLLKLLGPEAEVHVIDPVPQFDPIELGGGHPGFRFYRALSVDVLADLPPVDVALIDGDHNWFTVFNELRLLAATAEAAGAPLPVMVMHDVGWPYGRRDLYYDPQTIPPEYRQPYARQGIRPGQRTLRADGGLNSTVDNAIEEGGPRNGVLTALEDFAHEHPRALRTLILPAYFGLAIVAEEERVEREPALAALFDRLAGAETQQRLLALADRLWTATLSGQWERLSVSDRRADANAERYLDLLAATLGDEHLDGLRRCLDTLDEEAVEGDLVTCGAAPSGVFLRGHAEGAGTERVVWVADRFATPDVNEVRTLFARFDLLDERVRLLQGRLPDAVHDAELATIALLRLADVDGAAEALDVLYDRVALGGFVVVDAALRDAVDAFRARRAIEEPIERIDDRTALWRKREDRSGDPPATPAGVLERIPLAPPLREDAIDLSIVVVFHQMRREGERALHSLTRAYQEGVEDLRYEVIAVENGSTPDQALGEELVRSFGPEFRYLDLGEEAHPSPVRALNRGIAASRGRNLALMIDGAHILSPGVLRDGMAGLTTYGPAVVATQRFFLGPSVQWTSVGAGYDAEYEDRLLHAIRWPRNGYELFAISHFSQDRDWFDQMIESNCLFAPRALLEQAGGFDESFTVAGGEFANLDVYERLAVSPGVRLATILGEGVFHQVHGGTVSNVSDELERRRHIDGYAARYQELRNKRWLLPRKPIHYIGRLEKRTLRTKARWRPEPNLIKEGAAAPTDGLPREPALMRGELEEQYTDAFWHTLAWQTTPWLGRPVSRPATDLIAYQDLVARLRPDWVVVVAPQDGGLPSFLASICALTGQGQVVCAGGPPIDEVRSVPGDPEEPSVVAAVHELVGTPPNALVVLAARSSAKHTIARFEAYADVVPAGGYMILEDTIVGGNQVWPSFGQGPAGALDHIVKTSKTFAPDLTMERFGPTFNRNGFLRRVSPADQAG